MREQSFFFLSLPILLSFTSTLFEKENPGSWITRGVYYFKAIIVKLTSTLSQGMVLSQEYLVAVSGTHGDAHVRPLEIEIVNLKRQIQMNKQSISQNKYQLDSGVEVFRPGEVSYRSCVTGQ